MVARLQSVELSLPFLDDNLLGADESCTATENNAFYSPQHNKFTVCAGLFNLNQSSSSLAFVIAHELSHSIDSGSLSTQDWKKNSDIATVLRKLVRAKGAVYDCVEWKKIVATTFAQKNNIEVKNTNPLDAFYECLQSRKNLKPFATEDVRRIADMYAKDNIASYADANAFVNLAKQSFQKGEAKKTNELYLRPDLWLAQSKQTYDFTRDRSALVPEVYTQSLSCQKIEIDGQEISFKQAANDSQRALMQKNAIEEVLKITQRKIEDFYSYCGKTCPDLAKYSLSANPAENNSDWFAFRAMIPFLKKIPPENRKEASALATALFCEAPGVEASAPELTAVQKEYSFEVHPDSRIRRVSSYIPEMADLLGCKIDTNERGFALCAP